MYLPRLPNRKPAPSPTGSVSFPIHSQWGLELRRPACLCLPHRNLSFPYHTGFALFSDRVSLGLSFRLASAAHSARHSYPLIRLNIPGSTVHSVTHSLRYKYFYPDTLRLIQWYLPWGNVLVQAIRGRLPAHCMPKKSFKATRYYFYLYCREPHHGGLHVSRAATTFGCHMSWATFLG